MTLYANAEAWSLYSYAEDFITTFKDAERCALRWGGTWVVVKHPSRPGLYARGTRFSVPGEVLAWVRNRGYFSEPDYGFTRLYGLAVAAYRLTVQAKAARGELALVRHYSA